MSGVEPLSNSRLGAEPNCDSCGAGAQLSFNWAYAREHESRPDLPEAATFTRWQDLRRGSLFRCGNCGEVWHLDEAQSWMTHLPSDRVSLVLEWNRGPIAVLPEIAEKLARIRPTPPDIYGNGKDSRVTPCSIETTAGETFDFAMVCVQLGAPVQFWMDFRLGTEIAKITESPFALPLEVRLASSMAEEMRMGFSPSLIQMADEKKFVLNGMTSFMDEVGYRTADARISDGSYFREDPPPAFLQSPSATYFVVDGDPGWVVEGPARPEARRRKSWLARLLGRRPGRTSSAKLLNLPRIGGECI